MKLSLGLFLTFVLAVTASAMDTSKKTMNGYSLDQFPDFERKWHQVTVRYRKDTGELRFVYANPIAYKALLAGKGEYPDGSVFAKIGVVTQDDPVFPSSSVPSGSKRYQLMVRNHVKHKDTGGWGYAVFDANGEIFKDDSQTATQACFACHRIVDNKGYVFSDPIVFGVGRPALALREYKSQIRKLTYEDLPRPQWPPKLLELIPPVYGSLSSLTGDFRKYLFDGTLDEVKPMLARQVKSTLAPAALISADHVKFAAVLPTAKPAEECSASGRKGIWLEAISTDITADMNGQKIMVPRRFCQTD